MAGNDINVSAFLRDLNGGVLEEKLAHIISETALASIVNGEGGRKKGKITLEMIFQQVGDNDQVIIAHKLTQVSPTLRGKQIMEDTTETPMFVGKGGTLSINPPKEDSRGQYQLRSIPGNKPND